MADFEGKKNNSGDNFGFSAPGGNGEYRNNGGFQQDDRFYSDAHFSPADDYTAPNRYYTPREPRPAELTPRELRKKRKAERREEKKQKRMNRRGSFAGTLAICLICAILGAVGGAALVTYKYDPVIEKLEQSLNQNNFADMVSDQENNAFAAAAEEPLAEAAAEAGPIAGEAETEEETVYVPTANDIYSMACGQTVGITTEVTYQNFFGVKSSSSVTGSGFFITDDGYILTNYHVIEYAYEYGYTVFAATSDGTQYEAEIVGVESSNDLAVLKVDASGVSPAYMGDSNAISVGETVYAVGNPLGELEFTMTTGSVSALNREIVTESGTDPINMFQIDAAVNSGNSGGPVYNSMGEVIGVVTAKSKGTGIEGLGFAIPSNDAVKIADDLINKGYVTGKPLLGLTVDDGYTSVYTQYYDMPAGAYVRTVAVGGAADAAGIKKNDVITRLGGVEIADSAALRAEIKTYSAGDSAEVEIYREGEYLTVTVIFDEQMPSKSVGGNKPRGLPGQFGAPVSFDGFIQSF